MKKIGFWTAVLLLLPVLSGCKEEQQPAKYTYDFSAIYLDEHDTVSEIIVEDFDKEYYNIEELQQSLQETVNAYNEETGKTDAVILDRVDYSDRDKQVKVVIDYATAADYQKLTKRTLFIGTVFEAKKAGFTFGAFKDLQTGEEKYSSVEDLDESLKIIVYEKDETEDGAGGQELVTDQYTLLYDCAEVTSEATNRTLRATVVQ